MNSVMQEKKQYRIKLKHIDSTIEEHKKRRWSKLILKHLIQMALYKKAKTIALFIPLSDEPDMWPVIHDAWRRGKTVAIPRIKGSTLCLRRINSKNDLEIGTYGVTEPKLLTQSIPLRFIDTCFVPGQAFDRSGNRLGRGYGYYDRLLKKIRKPIVGICYGFRFVSVLPHKRHDRKVDGIVTEKGIYTVNN